MTRRGRRRAEPDVGRAVGRSGAPPSAGLAVIPGLPHIHASVIQSRRKAGGEMSQRSLWRARLATGLSVALGVALVACGAEPPGTGGGGAATAAYAGEDWPVYGGRSGRPQVFLPRGHRPHQRREPRVGVGLGDGGGADPGRRQPHPGGARGAGGLRGHADRHQRHDVALDALQPGRGARRGDGRGVLELRPEGVGMGEPPPRLPLLSPRDRAVERRERAGGSSSTPAGG